MDLSKKIQGWENRKLLTAAEVDGIVREEIKRLLFLPKNFIEVNNYFLVATIAHHDVFEIYLVVAPMLGSLHAQHDKLYFLKKFP